MQRVTTDRSNENNLLDRQRRTSPRRASGLTVAVLAPRTGTGVALNVSAGGVRVAVDCALHAGETCQVRLEDENGTGSVETLKVIWSRSLPGGWIAGLERTGVH